MPKQGVEVTVMESYELKLPNEERFVLPMKIFLFEKVFTLSKQCTEVYGTDLLSMLLSLKPLFFEDSSDLWREPARYFAVNALSMAGRAAMIDDFHASMVLFECPWAPFWAYNNIIKRVQEKRAQVSECVASYLYGTVFF